MEENLTARPSLAACLIVRNEASSLPECLQSLEDQVDSIYVTDTGSTDSTIEIARACGARVRTFEWCNNFAAARSASIEGVAEDWILIIDADDCFPAGEAARLREQLRTDACAATLLYAAVPGYTPIRAPRLFRNGLQATFTGRIHENLDAWISRRRSEGMALVHTDVRLQHTGYAGEAMPRKLARNLPLLEDEWHSLDNNAPVHRRLFIATELGTALAKSQRHGEAAALLQKCLSEISSTEGTLPLESLQLVINLAWLLADSGRAGEAVELIRNFENHFEDEPAYSLHRGLQELATANYQVAGTYLRAFRSAWESREFSIPVPLEYLGASWWRAMGLCHMGERDYAQAEGCFGVCCELDPYNPEHQLRRLVAGRMV